MRLITPTEVHAESVRALGLDPSLVDLSCVEALAGAIRRAAGFLCPCASSTLKRAVLEPLKGLIQDVDKLEENVEETIEALVAFGDLMEERDVTSDSGQLAGLLLYPSSPSFVRRQSGAALLLGVAPDRPTPLPEELAARIEYVGHVRRLAPNETEDLCAELSQLGLIELSYNAWLKAPPHETAHQHVVQLGRLLEEAPVSGEIPGLTLLDASRPVRYYRGRWVEPRGQTGRFVGRRRQAYGADLWCYVDMYDGRPTKFIDFPLRGSRFRGCDEAWRLQLAIDAERGEPQRFRQRQGPSSTHIVEFLSPVPMWARRRWDAVGEPVTSAGSLFAYRFAESEIEEELQFLGQDLWLEALPEGQKR